jgi:2-polyprenyl-3-methyl-5-hydroxy-6-metoxy-1,4-benzoquinol methylase
MNETTQSTFDKSYLNYQQNRPWIRKIVRKIYFWQAQTLSLGKTIDFGCGIGEKLSRFPEGSIGLEINKETVKYCQSKGLNVLLYDSKVDDYALANLIPNTHETFFISHVLEHLEDADVVLKKIFTSCARIGIQRVVIIVPCELGFKHDKTHRTFIDFDFIKSKGFLSFAGFEITKKGYFPLNFKSAGKFFTYNELYVVFDKKQ